MTEAEQDPRTVLEELSQLRAKVAELEQRLANVAATSDTLTSIDLQFYQTLLKNLPNGFVFVFDQNLQYVMVDGAGLAAPKEAIEGKLLKQLVSPQTYELIAYHYNLALKGQETSFEISYQEKTFLTRVRPIRNTQGAIIAGISMVQDITEQKQAEEALRQSELRYRAVSEMTSDFVWSALISPQGEYKIDWATDAIQTITGYTLTELEAIGGWPKVLHPDDLPLMVEGAGQIYTGQTAEGEFRITRKDGEARWLHFMSRPLLDEGGQIRGIIGASKDITEQKRTEETLRQNEARYRAVSEMTSDFVWAASPGATGRYKVDWITEAVEKVTGYSVTEFAEIGGIIGICYKEDSPVLLNMWQLVSNNTTKAVEFECRIICKNQEIRWLHITAFSLLENGQFSGLITAAKDVTERKQIEAEKKALEQQLQIVQRLESLGVLAGGLAHDFNNLLSVILGNLSLTQTALSDTDTDPDVMNGLQEAEKAGFRAIGLTRQLLTFAKGGAPIRKAADLREIIEDSARFMVSGSRAILNFKIEPGLALAEVDASQLSQVIQNLVINAVQAMPDGGKIELTARNVTLYKGEVATLGGGPHVLISIQDEGMGISPENMAKIFDPFFTTKPSGSGLGLAMVFSIIRRHEGYIQVQSIPGEGTRFTLYLPAARQPLNKEVLPTPAQAPPTSTGRILIMDDEPSIRQTLSRLLIHLGYSCEVASEGLEALQLYREAMAAGQPFTAVVLDLTVPNGMGGEETVRQILKNDPKAKVIVSSGYSDDAIMANFRKYGFSGIASKPYRLKELQKVLAEVIGKE